MGRARQPTATRTVSSSTLTVLQLPPRLLKLPIIFKIRWLLTLGGDSNQGGPGIMLCNKPSKPCTYFFYDNSWNGNSTAGANFTHSIKSSTVVPDAIALINLLASCDNRVQHGITLPATWVEFQLDAGNNHAAHGDISLEQGCDGAATISSTDDSRRINDFPADILKDAPEAAVIRKFNGRKALASTMGNWWRA
ncbi:MAG: hypothetical protein M1827_006876 [Pycnora praestabilis]|nr:MAG: hypothetical protein M1827_006876 [Pycnora praestabilis]